MILLHLGEAGQDGFHRCGNRAFSASFIGLCDNNPETKSTPGTSRDFVSPIKKATYGYSVSGFDAERTGFEPAGQFPTHRFSKPAPRTTQPPLQPPRNPTASRPKLIHCILPSGSGTASDPAVGLPERCGDAGGSGFRRPAPLDDRLKAGLRTPASSRTGLAEPLVLAYDGAHGLRLSHCDVAGRRRAWRCWRCGC